MLGNQAVSAFVQQYEKYCLAL